MLQTSNTRVEVLLERHLCFRDRAQGTVGACPVSFPAAACRMNRRTLSESSLGCWLPCWLLPKPVSSLRTPQSIAANEALRLFKRWPAKPAMRIPVRQGRGNRRAGSQPHLGSTSRSREIRTREYACWERMWLQQGPSKSPTAWGDRRAVLAVSKPASSGLTKIPHWESSREPQSKPANLFRDPRWPAIHAGLRRPRRMAGACLLCPRGFPAARWPVN